MNKVWIPTTPEEAYKRAAGRRRYHAGRQKAQSDRRIMVLEELEQVKWDLFGVGRRLAKKLGVSEATISRDISHWRSQRTKLGADAREAIAFWLERRSEVNGEPHRDD